MKEHMALETYPPFDREMLNECSVNAEKIWTLYIWRVSECSYGNSKSNYIESYIKVYG